MGKCQDATLMFARDRAREPARVALAAVVALVMLGLCAPGVWAGAPARTNLGHSSGTGRTTLTGFHHPDEVPGGPTLTSFDRPTGGPGTTTLINFDLPNVVPGTASPQAGQVLGDQYEPQGVVFGGDPVATAPSYCRHDEVFYRDTANARSQPQVAYSFCPPPNGESFSQYAEIDGQLTTWSDQVSVYAGAPGGVVNGTPYPAGDQVTTLQGYDVNGKPIAGATATATVGAAADTLLSISTPTPEIAYFTVTGGNAIDGTAAPLEIDDLSFEVPPAPPPPQLTLAPLNPITEGYQGQTVSVPVTVHRFDGADNPVDLSVSGLPSGVTLTGGTTIAAGSDTTDLTFAIAADAPVASTQFTLAATSAGVSAPPPDQGTFNVNAALTIGLTQSGGLIDGQPELTVTATPCSSTTVYIVGNAAVPGTLTIASQGDTAGLSASLSGSSVGPDYHQTLTLTSTAAGPGTATGTATYTITLNGGTAPPVTATLTVNRVAGTITSVFPRSEGQAFFLPKTPQALLGGTQVVIDGSGLCVGSTVEFGNQKATATPFDFGPNGTFLAVAIPWYATSGTVTVHTPAGNLAAPHSFHVDNFRDTWGWAFANYHLAASSVNTSVESTLFGDIWLTNPFGQTLTPDAALWLSMVSHSAIGQGVCLGMSGLIQWLSNQTPAFYLDQALDGLGGGGSPYVVPGPSGPSPSLERMITVFELDGYSGQFQNYMASEMDESTAISPMRTVDAVKSALPLYGAYSWFPIVAMQNQGPGGGGHAVVAYDVESDGAGGYYIDVYDPNTPYTPGEDSDTTGASHQAAVDASRIHVNADGSWTFGGFSPAWHGDAHHLYAVPWGVLPDPFSGNINTTPQFPSFWSLLGITSAGSASMSQVTDAPGHTLINPDGSQNVDPATRIPHASLVFPATGSATAGPPTALLPGTGTYEVTERGRRAGAYTDTVMGGGIDGLVDSSTKPGVADQIGMNPRSGMISFTPGGNGGKPLTIEMISHQGHDSSRTVTLTTTSFHGGVDSLAFRGGSVQYSNTGPATTVTVQLSSVGTSGLPVALSTGPVQIGPGQSATFTPTSWLNLAAVTVKIAGHGQHRTFLLHNTLQLPAPVRSLTLSVSSGHSLKRVLTIHSRLGKLPPGAELEFVWIVRRGTRVDARHVITLTGGQLHPGARSESFTFTAPAAGSYRFTGVATLLVMHGITEAGRSIAKTVALTLEDSQ